MTRAAASLVAVLCMGAISVRADDLLFRDEQYLFRFSYPDSWAEVPTSGKDIRAFVANDGGRGLANCNVLVRPMPALEHLSRAELEAEIAGMFTREFMEGMVGSTSGAEVIQAGEDTLDSRPAGFAVVNLTHQTAGIQLESTNIVVVTITTMGMYQITCGAARDQFERIAPDLMKIVTSFRFDDEQK